MPKSKRSRWRLDRQGRSFATDFYDSPEEAQFRADVREFIGANLSPTLIGYSPYAEHSEERIEALRRWRASLSEKGWIAPHWPREYGGGGFSAIEQFIFNEEMAEARAPEVGGMGVQMIGPILIRFGTEEQRRQHLSKITSGEVTWCQGYSEPGSGSDLASLQTRAVKDGDDYIISGQKIWTSGAHRSDWTFLLARTDPAAPKHRGISMFLIDMKSPGVTVQPLITMAGEHVFNEVFFEDVRVPAQNLVGEENRGWYIGAALLDFERSNIGRAVALRHTARDLAKIVRDHLSEDQRRRLRTEVAERVVEAEIARLIGYRVISLQKRGQVPNYEASMNKLFRSEATQRMAQTGMKVLGMYGGLHGDERLSNWAAPISHSYLSTISATIAAGTSEINRNVIATRGLGLPRS